MQSPGGSRFPLAAGEAALELGRILRASFALEEEFFTEEVEAAWDLLVLPLGRHSVGHLRTGGEGMRSRKDRERDYGMRADLRAASSI